MIRSSYCLSLSNNIYLWLGSSDVRSYPRIYLRILAIIRRFWGRVGCAQTHVRWLSSRTLSLILADFTWTSQEGQRWWWETLAKTKLPGTSSHWWCFDWGHTDRYDSEPIHVWSLTNTIFLRQHYYFTACSIQWLQLANTSALVAFLLILRKSHWLTQEATQCIFTNK